MRVPPVSQPTLVQRLQAATPIKQMEKAVDQPVKGAGAMSHTTDLQLTSSEIVAKMKAAQGHRTKPSFFEVMNAYAKADLT